MVVGGGRDVGMVSGTRFKNREPLFRSRSLHLRGMVVHTKRSTVGRYDGVRTISYQFRKGCPF